MKIKKYIEPKRQYSPPRIYVKALLMESKLLAGTTGTGHNMPGEGGNPRLSKGVFAIENDELEE